MTENEIGTIVVESAIAVHRELGPGLLETVYEVVLARELQDRGLNVERQVPVAIQYKDIRFDEGFRADIIVDSKVILELKSVEHVSAAHKKDVLCVSAPLREEMIVTFQNDELESRSGKEFIGQLQEKRGGASRCEVSYSLRGCWTLR
jgi:GxxExxY protein